MKKLYCYVDETGQDTEGNIFLVSIVITGDERDHLADLLQEIERISGKGEDKWNKSKDESRSAYIRLIFQEPVFKAKLYYAFYRQNTDYVSLTVQATASAIVSNSIELYKATIVVDGLRKSERQSFGSQLRKYGVRTEKVRGITEQANIFIRLADALCGYLRDALTGREEFRRSVDRAIKQGYLVEVK